MKKVKMIKLLDVSRNPEEKFDTQYGNISGIEWIEKEAERIGS